MNVTCNKCGKRYVIADEKVVGKASVKIRCKQCQNLIQLTPVATAFAQSISTATASPVLTATASSTVALTGTNTERSPWDDEATRAMPAPNLTSQWFAMIAGKQEGPFDLRGLGQKAGVGEVTLRTYLWKPGMDNWRRAADVPDVSAVFAAAPGVSSGASATATGLMQASPGTQRPSRGSAGRDVAVANERPSGVEFATSSQIISAPAGLEPAARAHADQTATASGVSHTQAPLNELFNDVHGSANSNATSSSREGTPLSGELDDEEPTKGEYDPFAALGEVKEGEAPPPGEATKFFIAQAGVNRRNPPWKIALFVLGGIGGPLVALYLLSTLHVIPQVTVVREDGQEVRENFFSSTGIGGLKDMLTGEKARKTAEAEEKRRVQLRKAALAAAATTEKPAGEKKPDKGELVAGVTGPKPGQPDMAALFKDDQKKMNAPKNRDDPSALAADTTGGSGLSADAAAKVVNNSRKSFEGCIEAALRRSPNLAVGNITVNLTVGASGAVKAAGIEPAKWQGSDWAQCMITAGKRIVFPSSDGDSEVQVPLKVGVTM